MLKFLKPHYLAPFCILCSFDRHIIIFVVNLYWHCENLNLSSTLIFFLRARHINHKVYCSYVALMRCSFSIYQDMKQPEKTNLRFDHENA